MLPLLDVLERSRSLGFLGPGPVRVHVDHALGFARGLDGSPGRFLDLGSGGGVPGLVLAAHWPAAEAVLLDARERRCAFLEEAVRALQLGGRARVVCARAEDAGRRKDLRAAFDAVVARGFGRPAVTAECAAPFLRVGGTLVVSEPPATGAAGQAEGTDRWPADALASLGLLPARSWTGIYTYRVLRQVDVCPLRFPRRSGIPAKRPLF